MNPTRSPVRQRGGAFAAIVVILAAHAAAIARADVTYPDRPGEREFILDEADLITAEDAASIRVISDSLLTDKRAPLIVVTLESLASHGAGGWPIERYAMNLFAEWSIGWDEWNHGILLLVSEGDRRARIELGAGWGRAHDPQAQQIMDGVIIPNFKRGEFSQGILEGVQALGSMARGEVPAAAAHGGGRSAPASGPSSAAPGVGGGISSVICFALPAIVVVIAIISAMRSRGGSTGYGGYGGFGGAGRGGFGWGSFFLGGLLGGLGSTMYHRSRSNDRFGGGGIFGGSGGGGGGWSGGSFGGGGFGGGGGFSGGGGASGGW